MNDVQSHRASAKLQFGHTMDRSELIPRGRARLRKNGGGVYRGGIRVMSGGFKELVLNQQNEKEIRHLGKFGTRRDE